MPKNSFNANLPNTQKSDSEKKSKGQINASHLASGFKFDLDEIGKRQWFSCVDGEDLIQFVKVPLDITRPIIIEIHTKEGHRISNMNEYHGKLLEGQDLSRVLMSLQNSFEMELVPQDRRPNLFVARVLGGRQRAQ